MLRELFDLYSDKDMCSVAVWGDKTPNYVEHVNLIGQQLPRARFIHILRDPRDQALSERVIWGKSLQRSADAWRRRVESARLSLPARDGRYREIRYEDLVEDPRRELSRLLEDLDLDFDERMLRGAPGSDELGQMVGAERVSTAAVGGRRAELSTGESAVIAGLVGKLGREAGYDLPLVDPVRLSTAQRFKLQLRDRLNMVRYHVRSRGLMEGLRFAVAGANEHTRRQV
jgi:hypothetical protein